MVKIFRFVLWIMLLALGVLFSLVPTSLQPAIALQWFYDSFEIQEQPDIIPIISWMGVRLGLITGLCFILLYERKTKWAARLAFLGGMGQIIYLICFLFPWSLIKELRTNPFMDGGYRFWIDYIRPMCFRAFVPILYAQVMVLLSLLFWFKLNKQETI